MGGQGGRVVHRCGLLRFWVEGCCCLLILGTGTGMEVMVGFAIAMLECGIGTLANHCSG